MDGLTRFPTSVSFSPGVSAISIVVIVLMEVVVLGILKFATLLHTEWQAGYLKPPTIFFVLRVRCCL